MVDDPVLLTEGPDDPNYIEFEDRNPRQWKVECLNEECQREPTRNIRMHSQIRKRDLRDDSGGTSSVPGWWDDDMTYARCNVCGTIRVVD